MGEINGHEVRLAFYSHSYERAIEDYVIREIQFTAHPREALEQCMREGERHAVLILHGSLLVGFFVLHTWAGAKKYSENRRALLLRAFSVDSRFQGKGYGKQALALLDDFIKLHFPDVNEIVLGVNHANVRAQQLYLHHGFSDTGRRVIGTHGEQFVYHKKMG
ncbi:GNAT family N-acetyltransferase [Sporolactobacillus shoreae]|uniref:GNAT family N-acetyltransferase n=1 Tax=Sporolactobacillus shoreae TaxID=1465501 RepID=A0A4Z0GLH9_9BACL|nr:GNAT family N-acetyltransferase [Sporolactobacillus shoreae]TGA96648.1 GNAT family N-acetyltransferase [Sporolactobacillus shoreae]